MRWNKYIFLLVFIVLASFNVRAQNQNPESGLYIQPLFEYPVAPDNLESINDRCNFIVENFWKDFDFKAKKTVDQNALNHAFSVYVTSIMFADAKNADASINKLLSNIGNNEVLRTQFLIAAEENLYGPRAEYWNDDLYIKFIDLYLKNKNLSENRRNRYTRQKNALTKCRIDSEMPEFKFIDNKGSIKEYFPMSTPTLIIFGDPSDPDWRMARLKMEMDYKLSDAVEKGKANIIYIITNDIPDWESMVSNYPPKWSTGKGINPEESIDIRLNPSIYVIDSTGKITIKNSNLQEAVNKIIELIS